MKRKPMGNRDSKHVFAKTWDNGKDHPLPVRGGYRL